MKTLRNLVAALFGLTLFLGSIACGTADNIVREFLASKTDKEVIALAEKYFGTKEVLHSPNADIQNFSIPEERVMDLKSCKVTIGIFYDKTGVYTKSVLIIATQEAYSIPKQYNEDIIAQFSDIRALMNRRKGFFEGQIHGLGVTPQMVTYENYAVQPTSEDWDKLRKLSPEK